MSKYGIILGRGLIVFEYFISTKSGRGSDQNNMAASVAVSGVVGVLCS